MYDNIKKIGVYATTGIASLATAFTLCAAPVYGESILERAGSRIFKLGGSIVLAPFEAYGTLCNQINEEGLKPTAITKGAFGAVANPVSSVSRRSLETTFTLLDPNPLDNRKLCDQSALKNITDAIADPFKAD